MIVDAAIAGATLAAQQARPPLTPESRLPPNQIDQAAQDFEAFFLSQMFGYMFAGIETNSLFGGGHGETIYRSLLIEEYGKAVASSGGIGVADAVAREMLNLQESARP